MVGHDRYPSSHARLHRTLRNVDLSVLFAEVSDARAGVLDDEALTTIRGRDTAIGRERLRSGIDHNLPRHCGADHRGQDARRTVIQCAIAAAQRVDVINYAGAGANFADRWRQMCLVSSRRGSCRNGSRLEAVRFLLHQMALDDSLNLGQLRGLLLWRRPDAAGIAE